MDIQNLPIKDIRIDGDTQARVELNDEIILEYHHLIMDAVALPPIVVFEDDDNCYWLADGFHRRGAYLESGIDKIPCLVELGSRRDAILYSVGANQAHGLRRSNADKRKAVMTLLGDEEWSQWSNREIARRCGVGESTVRKHRDNSILRDSRSMDSPERTFIHPKTGTESTMKTGKIGVLTVDDLPDDCNWNDDEGIVDDPEDAGIEEEEPPEPELIMPDEPEDKPVEYPKPSLAQSPVDLLGNIIKRDDVAHAFADAHLISDATKALRAFRTTQRKLIKDQHPLSAMIHQSLDRTITDCIHDIEDTLPYCVIPENVPKDDQNKKYYQIGWLTKRQHALLPSDWK